MNNFILISIFLILILFFYITKKIRKQKIFKIPQNLKENKQYLY